MTKEKAPARYIAFRDAVCEIEYVRYAGERPEYVLRLGGTYHSTHASQQAAEDMRDAVVYQALTRKAA